LETGAGNWSGEKFFRGFGSEKGEAIAPFGGTGGVDDRRQGLKRRGGEKKEYCIGRVYKVGKKSKTRGEANYAKRKDCNEGGKGVYSSSEKTRGQARGALWKSD